MKKLFLTLSLMALALTVTAMPAKRGVWKTLTLADGTEVRAQLVGDEHGHYWRAADGRAYTQATDADYFMQADLEAITLRANARRQQANELRTKRLPSRQAKRATVYTGQRKGLILLVNFSDKKFKNSHNNALYTRIANEQGYSEGSFKGSVSDYFKDQSLGQFELDFDVVGPLTVSKTYSYYGKNDSEGNDMYPGTMVSEAVNLAKEQVEDWAQYDWDNDGYIDQVYVMYAGYGEADYYDSKTIWPHEYQLSYAKYYGDGSGPVSVGNGLKVDTYACGSELSGDGSINGIGTMCHEFSHCLGYPDFYDTDYSGGPGMYSWDLMDNGAYNDDGYQPAAYTGYERWVAGWVEPIVLEDEDVTVEAMQPLSESGECYIIYNQKQRNEYYMLENRQLKGWDASLPGSGLLIVHVDYNKSVWENNQPNDDPSHQRMTWVPADNKVQTEYWQGQEYIVWDGCKNDPFPYGSVTAFNKATTPAATLFNKNTDGTKYLSSSIENIRRNSDGTIAFQFYAEYGSSSHPEGPDEPIDIDGATFYESFDLCEGTGGNDGLWKGTIATASLTPDNEGWISDNTKIYGANKCARFGTGTVYGTATTPLITIGGESTLQFNAGAWDGTNDATTLYVKAEGGSVYPDEFTLTKGAFNTYQATVTAEGNVTLTFYNDRGRFFLDEVIVSNPTLTAIRETLRQASDTRIFTLDGRLAGTSLDQLRPGLYIVAGRKVVKK